jgi:hypothetical protein
VAAIRYMALGRRDGHGLELVAEAYSYGGISDWEDSQEGRLEKSLPGVDAVAARDLDLGAARWWTGVGG